MITSLSNFAPGSLVSVRQCATARSHSSAARRERPPLEIGDRGLVDRDQAGARARLDRHVA